MPQSPKVYQPQGFRRVSDKLSAAYCFVGERAAGRFSVIAYYAMQSKPAFSYYYRSEAEREAKIKAWFLGCQKSEAYKAERKAEKRAKAAAGHGLKVGQVLRSSWGYDQTNVDWYEIVKLVGKQSAMIAKIANSNLEGSESSWASGQCFPSDSPDRIIGEAFLVRLGASGCKVGHQYASPWDGKPAYWSAYA